MLENDYVKILWDFSIQTDCKLKYNKPEILIADKQARECRIIYVACPFDTKSEGERARKGRMIPQIEEREGDFGNTKKW